MENKINIVELLKDCPSGMELDCTIYDDVTLYKIDDSPEHEYPIRIETKKGYFLDLTKYGTYTDIDEAKCVIFPKGKTTWEGFIPPYQFKDGDVLATDLGSVFYLNTRLNNDECYGCYVGIGGDGSFHICEPFAYKECCGLAAEEEKQKLFQAIKDYGYKWNEETKTLEKLVEPKFKVGDKITDKNKFIYRITEVTDKCYKLHDLKTTFITFEEADSYFVKVVDIFDISTLKPFDEVLVRQDENEKWGINFFGFYNYDEGYYYTTGNWIYKQCIPYEGNEYLLGTTDNCDNFYKTWKL